jgi:hypothetical protein
VGGLALSIQVSWDMMLGRWSSTSDVSKDRSVFIFKSHEVNEECQTRGGSGRYICIVLTVTWVAGRVVTSRGGVGGT